MNEYRKFNIRTVIVCIVCILAMVIPVNAAGIIGAELSYSAQAVVAGGLAANGLNYGSMSSISAAQIYASCYNDAPADVKAQLAADGQGFRVSSADKALATGPLSVLSMNYLRQWYAQKISEELSQGTIDESTIPAPFQSIVASDQVQIPANVTAEYNSLNKTYKVCIYHPPVTVGQTTYPATWTIHGTDGNRPYLNDYSDTYGDRLGWRSPTATWNINMTANGTVESASSSTARTIYITETGSPNMPFVYWNYEILGINYNKQGITMTTADTLPVGGGVTSYPYEQNPYFNPAGPGALPVDVPVTVTLPYTDNPDTNAGELPAEVGADTVVNGITDLSQDVFDIGQVIETLTGIVPTIWDLIRTEDVTWSEPSTIVPYVPTSTVPELESMKLPALVMTRFPFCIPFDLARAFSNLVAPPVVPSWDIPFVMDRYGFNETIHISFEEFSVLATITRWGFSVVFLIGLILVTRNLIRG